MTEDGFIIIETTTRPKPAAKPEPLIAEEPGRTFADLSPEQKARTVRSQNGPLFCEPLFDNNGPTGRWWVGRIMGAEEVPIGEFANKTEAMEYFRQQVVEFYGLR